MDTKEIATVLNQYLSWLHLAFKSRLQAYFNTTISKGSVETGTEIPETQEQDPFTTKVKPSHPDTPLPTFIEKHNLPINEQLLLLLALAPHVNPVFLDEAIYQHIPSKGDFPQLGGVKGVQFRGVLPTGETASFLLAGNDLEQRLAVQQLFSADHLFARAQVLWLDTVPEGEPAMSGKLVLSQEYVDYFLKGHHTIPRFGADFPAERITTPLDWSDLVLNVETMEQVMELRKWLRYKASLVKINKRLKPGYRALFYGPPGTGKTLTACLLGKAATKEDGSYEVFRIDLSQVVSKFIGETEKNLSKLFDKAEHKDWILFFDEADALFGKRTNIRDAHDKYANQEISYLLQRVENYNGLVILASNYKSNIDPAFARRFQAVIQFPMPTPEERLHLWKMIITKEYVEDEKMLKSISYKYELSGASIINIAQSCFLKNMNKEGKIALLTNTDIEEAINKEFSKEGKIPK